MTAPPDSVVPVGTRLGHFRIVERIGEGGMGVVYRAEDEKLRRVVALKVLPIQIDKGEEGRRRLLREARSAAAVHHPNIATVFDVGEADGRVYVAMELVEGRTLRRVLQDGRLAPKEASRIALGIARALGKAHERGIVHRDLKPDNVMLDGEGEVKVLDFGLAKPHLAREQTDLGSAPTAEQVTQDGMVVGTPGYMSPEQAKGKAVDPRTDVFAFGVVLYEMLTGERPFKGETTLDVLIAASRDAAAPVSSLNPSVAPELQRVVERCLAKSPDGRYATGRELAHALESLVSTRGTPVLDRKTGRPGARARRGWRRTAFGLTVLGLSAFVVTLVVMRVGRDVPRSAPSAAARPPPAPAVTAITDLPPPKTAHPEAAAAYAAGLQAFRDASIAAGIKSFRRALELDPDLAPAALQLVAGEFGTIDQLRAWVAMAGRQRATLTERDAAMLDVLQVEHAGDVPDRAADVERWRAVAARFPSDAEIVFIAAIQAREAGKFDEAFRGIERARALDPKFAWTWAERAVTEEMLGKQDDALVSTAHCLALSPSAATCLRVRARVETERGECAKVEEDARRMIALEPDGEHAYEWLASALFSRGAPIESVQQALYRARDHSVDPMLAAQRDLDARAIGPFARGDFVAPLAAFREAEKTTQQATTESAVSFLVVRELSLMEEAGEEARMVPVADDFVRRLPSLIPDAPGVARPLVLAVRRRAGRISDAEMRAIRDAWMKEDAAMQTPGFTGQAWLDFLAFPARTPEDAREALAALPAWSPLPPSCEKDLFQDAALGHVYLLAGRASEAVPYLRRATAICFGDGASLLFHLRATADLGEALEAGGDTAGACAAYGEVLARWGAAKPRSVTADRARAHARALKCPAR